ncbi:MAG: HEPN domain-containing protein [Lachnospiraceae bacterium]|nr:HEPN domain-containing protein [Lachnospiraceae bacterium]
MDVGNFKDVSKYRFEQAEDDLDTAKLLLEAEKYKAANNRAYYACFHAIDAVLALEEIAFKKHKDTLAYFNRQYVHGGDFPDELGHKIAQLQVIRHKSDYDTFYVASKKITEMQVQTAEEVISLVGKYLQDN